MKRKNEAENKWGMPKLPKLRLRYRILLYFLMIFFAALALAGAVLECFPYSVEIAVYTLAAATLFSGICYLIRDMRYGFREIVKPGIAGNPYANRVVTDYRLRTILFSVPGTAGNIVFAVFNGAAGIISRSAWFGSLSAYYILLSMMRIGAVKQERKILKIGQERERMKKEIAIYRRNSVLFIIMAMVLGGIVILLETSMGGKSYPGFTIYAAAAYAFYRIITATINMIKVNAQRSPLLMTIRKIGYIDACVSILTLQTAMLASFGKEQEEFIKLMNGFTGAAVSLIVLGMGIQGIYASNKMKIRLKTGGILGDSYTGSRG